MKQLTGQDALFLNAETHGMPMHLSCFSVYHGDQVDLNALENSIQVRLKQELSILRYRLHKVPMNLDFPYWLEDHDFNPLYHIQRIALANPKDPDSLNQLLARLHAQPLIAERPPWQIWIIDGLGDSDEYPENSVGLLFKIHHALMHFGNGEKIFHALHGMADTRNEIETNSAQFLAEEGEMVHGESSPSTLSIVSRALFNNGKQSLKLMALAGSTLAQIQKQHAEGKALIPHAQAARCLFNQRVSAGRVVMRLKFPLHDLNINADLLAIDVIGKAVHQYLQHQQPEKDIDLIAGIPLIEDEQFCQRAIFSRVALHNQEADAQQRQALIDQELHELNDNIQLPKLANSLVDNLYAPLMAWGVKSFVNSGIGSLLPPLCHCIISQVPGFQSYFENSRFELGGMKLIDAFGLGPLIPNVGLFHAVATTDSHLEITITACDDHLQNPGLYKELLLAAFEDLSSIAASSDADKESVATAMVSNSDSEANSETVYDAETLNPAATAKDSAIQSSNKEFKPRAKRRRKASSSEKKAQKLI